MVFIDIIYNVTKSIFDMIDLAMILSFGTNFGLSAALFKLCKLATRFYKKDNIYRRTSGYGGKRKVEHETGFTKNQRIRLGEEPRAASQSPTGNRRRKVSSPSKFAKNNRMCARNSTEQPTEIHSFERRKRSCIRSPETSTN